MTPLLLRLMIAAALAGTLSLCSLAIERMTGDKKTAVLREHPKKRRAREAHYCRPRRISKPVGQSVPVFGRSAVSSTASMAFCNGYSLDAWRGSSSRRACSDNTSARGTRTSQRAGVA